MNHQLRETLLDLARRNIMSDDPAHDFGHSIRVLANAEKIAKKEKADLDIIVPAALFHDVINHPKNDPRAAFSAAESADFTAELLEQITDFPQEKIHAVSSAIRQCSFSKGIIPDELESKILQDADGLEVTGALAIMRTFAYSGKINRPFYHPEDPFCQNRQPEDLKYSVDLFYTRLLKIEARMYTKTAKAIAKRRSAFLHRFLQELDKELQGK